MRLLWAALLLGGCFNSQPAEGLLCGHHDECPSGMTCDRYAELPTCLGDTLDAGPEPSFGAPGPPALVSLSGGTFHMGCNAAIEANCMPDEAPARDVTVRDFTITQREITNDEFAVCVDARVCTSPPSLDRAQPMLPVRGLHWGQARSYCAWARMRLPTEAEWEYAARGTRSWLYPWGQTPSPDCDLAVMAGCPGGLPLAVGSKPAGRTPEGVDDLAGNVAEWVNDFFLDHYDAGDTQDPRGPASGTQRVIRGGSYQSDAVALRASRRDGADPLTNAGTVGFRCVR